MAYNFANDLSACAAAMQSWHEAYAPGSSNFLGLFGFGESPAGVTASGDPKAPDTSDDLSNPTAYCRWWIEGTEIVGSPVAEATSEPLRAFGLMVGVYQQAGSLVSEAVAVVDDAQAHIATNAEPLGVLGVRFLPQAATIELGHDLDIGWPGAELTLPVFGGNA